MLHRLDDKAKPLSQCLTGAEVKEYIKSLITKVTDKAMEVGTFINNSRKQTNDKLTFQSDAFILRQPRDYKSISDITDLRETHLYALQLIEELSAHPLYPMWKSILRCNTFYFALWVITHTLQKTIRGR